MSRDCCSVTSLNFKHFISVYVTARTVRFVHGKIDPSFKNKRNFITISFFFSESSKYLTVTYK